MSVHAPVELSLFDDGSGASAWSLADELAPHLDELEREGSTPDEALRAMVQAMGSAGLLRYVSSSGEGPRSMALCAARERLGIVSPLADLAFAMQGLGSNPITLAGTDEQRRRWMPPVVSGAHVAAFALTEPEAGSDLAGIACTAERDGNNYVINGTKVFISNASVADMFTVFVATQPPGEKHRITALVASRDTAGLTVEPTAVLGGHPIGTLHFKDARVPVANRLGDEGRGLAVALGTLHRYRTTVGAAAVGFATRALMEAKSHVKARRQFGAPLADLAAVQIRIADMACRVDAARMLVYRAAHCIDAPVREADANTQRSREAYTASVGKLFATEEAQRVIDDAVQLHGGKGVTADHVVAKLYQEIRALRIYEGTSDVQKVLIARHILAHK